MAFVFARFLALGVTRDQDPAPWACFINGAGLVLTQKWACIQKRKHSEGKSAIIKVFCQFSPFGEDAWLALDIFWAGKDGIGGFTEGAIKVAGIRVSLVGFAHRKSWEKKRRPALRVSLEDASSPWHLPLFWQVGFDMIAATGWLILKKGLKAETTFRFS